MGSTFSRGGGGVLFFPGGGGGVQMLISIETFNIIQISGCSVRSVNNISLLIIR